MKKLHKNIKFLSLLLAIALLFGCGTGETAKDPAGTITIQSPSFPEIQGMVSKVIAYLEIAGLNCPLTVDSDTTLNGQCPNIPNGTYSYTLKYVYTDTGVTLATTGGTATMESGQNHELSFPSLSKDYDDDSDGYTNLEEVKAGTNPKSSSSKPATPSAPTGVAADAEDGQATISWNAVSGATSYNIYWSTTSGVTKTNGTKITGATSLYTHTGLTNGTTYYYVVTAVNSNGESV